ncbi:MAG: hypothetical protein RLZZ450_5008 [Pseudomonadota bacterium]|jgi:hypothetical protein
MGDGAREGLLGLLLRLLVALGLLSLVFVGVRWYGLGFGPVHRVREPAADLSPTLARDLTARAAEVHDSLAAEEAALQVTADLLYFGFRHRTDLHFEHARQANGVEYAELFASAFNYLTHEAGLTAHARVVRSQPTSLMGLNPSHPAMQVHDWVVIADGSLRRYVDPMLHDAWLGADVSRNVQGAVDMRGPAPAPVRARRANTPGRPERIPNNAPHISTIRRAEQKREQADKAAHGRTSSALKWMEKLGVSLP